MPPVKLGSTVITASKVEGKVVARQEFHDAKADAQVLVEWTDEAGDTAQAWHEESTVKVQG